MTARMQATKRERFAKVTPAIVREMRDMHAKGSWTFDALAKHFGVSIGLTHGIVKRRKWGDVK